MNIYREKCNVISLEGNDSLDFLSRISATNIGDIRKDINKRILFTDTKGRIIDFSILFYRNNIFHILCSNGNNLNLLNHLNKYLISEDIFLSQKDFYKFTLPENEYKNDDEIYLKDDYAFKKIILLSEKLNPFSYNANINFLSENEFKFHSFENFYLNDIDVLNSEVNPIECGLKDFISFNKGCYIGQEVIARLDAQNKIPKILVLLESKEIITKHENIFFKEYDKYFECGKVFSITEHNNKYYALGFIKSDYTFKDAYFNNKNYILKIKKYIYDYKN